jgi:hypothetical protein
LFENNLSKIPAGRSRLVVRNLASAPDVMVRLDGKPIANAITNGQSVSSLRSPGTHSVDAVAADSSAQLVRATPLRLKAGDSTVVYVVGSAAEGTLDFMVQPIASLGDSPTAVTAGSGGSAAPRGFPMWVGGLMGTSALTAAGCIAMLRRKRMVPRGHHHV